MLDSNLFAIHGSKIPSTVNIMFVFYFMALFIKFKMRTSYALAVLVECIRKRKEWDVYELIVDLLANEEVDVLEAKEERNFR
jgi:hypothetical protein